MGRIDVDFAEAAPNDCDHDQCAPDQERHRIDIVEGRSASGKEQWLAESVNPCSKHDSEAKDNKLDSPLHRPHSRSECSFEIHQNQHRCYEQDAVQRFGRCISTDPAASACYDRRKNWDQLIQKNQECTYRD